MELHIYLTLQLAMRMRYSSSYFQAFVTSEYLTLTGEILYIDQYCTTLLESICGCCKLFLVIYADFRGTEIAQINGASRNSKGPILL